MDLDRLREDLKRDEGVKYEIYLDHLGLATLGVGHLIREGDPEKGLPAGEKISKERVNECFAKDVETVLSDCRIVFSGFDSLPGEAQLVIANMMFNMGGTHFRGFKKFIAAVKAGDWMEAGAQMRDSRWCQQVTSRAERLKKRIEALA